jgi:CNT family concentrative nucleoside transporter
MGAPAGLVMAKIMVPETEEPKTAGGVQLEGRLSAWLRKLTGKAAPAPLEGAEGAALVADPDAHGAESSIIEAAAKGAADGMHLAFIVGAMLLAFISLLALINAGFGLFHTSLETILGYIFYPLTLAMGVPSADAATVGSLLGQKIVLNEFVAYSHLSEIIQGKAAGVSLSPQAATIATYALCGFANFSSIAINIGCVGGIAPSRRGELAKLGLRAMIGGALASCMTATIAGILS